MKHGFSSPSHPFSKSNYEKELFFAPDTFALRLPPISEETAWLSFILQKWRSHQLPLGLKELRREGFDKVGILQRRGGRARLLVVRAKQLFGSGDGGWDKGSSSRVLGNLVLAIGLTYLTATGQLGWLFDALVSIWLLAFLLPIVGFGVFFWFAGRNLIQSNCPNCGNYFQILKSSMKDGVQLCPYCTQPFSVHGNKFEREPTRFSSKKSEADRRTSMGSRPYTQQGASAAAILDIEAEVKDVE